MRGIAKFYSTLEQSFFSTLTRKLIGNLGALLAIQALTLAAVWFGIRNLDAAVASAGIEATAAVQISAIGQGILTNVTLIFALAVAATAATLFFLRYLIVVPVRELNRAFRQGESSEADLSFTFPTRTHDEFRDLAQNLNMFSKRLRESFISLRRMGVNIAVSSVQVGGKVRASAQKAEYQNEMAGEIFAGSSETTSAHMEIADHTQKIAGATSANLETARRSHKELIETSSQIEQMSTLVDRSVLAIADIHENSKQIREIVTVIKTISSQTSLLALNAAIEAARAGRAGRGFSIVADEVKRLAEQVNTASEDIAETVRGMLERIEASRDESEQVRQVTVATRSAVERSCTNFGEMMEALERTDSSLQGISASVEELSSSNHQMHGKVGEIRSASTEVTEMMQQAEDLSSHLRTITEELQETVARFRTGEGALEKVIEQTRHFRDEMQSVMLRHQQSGLNLFDQNYRPIPGTDPPKYHTAYDERIEAELRACYDRTLAQIPGGRFAICFDVNGYAPTHNSTFCQPPSGDYQTDLAKSRDKRIYNDPTGLRAARNTRPILLQTYMRDTGEILCDLAMPITLQGRHWGTVRVGLEPKSLLEETPAPLSLPMR